MIELIRQDVNGKPATVAYRDGIFGALVAPERATVAFVNFDDGGSSIFFVTKEPKTLVGEEAGHEFHGNQWTGKNEAEKAEAGKQLKLAGEQTSPLAHPIAVIGQPEMNLGYHAVENYVAAYGQEFKTQALPADVERGQLGECYKNATLLVVGRDDLTYAEGWAMKDPGGLAVMHAWAVDKNDKVIDPTIPDPENWHYFGVRYNRERYLGQIIKAKFYGVLGSHDKNVPAVIRTGGKRFR